MGSSLLCAFSHGAMFSQTEENKTAACQLSFLPPLSTNGIRSYQYTNGASFNILGGISKNEKAFAFAGLSNIILNNGKGMSVAGLVNITKNQYSGFQFAGVANYAGKVKGFQLAGVANRAGDVSGFQFGGIINKARNVSGVQFAGLLNIAESSSYPIGLVNIIKDGEMGVAVSYNESGSAMVTSRSGGDAEGGLGARILCLPWLRINNELKIASISSTSESPTFIANYSLLPAFRINRHMELFGGPSINYMNAKNTECDDLLPKHAIWKKNSDTRLQRGYIGYQAGVQFIF